jgi:hypothetical protein
MMIIVMIVRTHFVQAMRRQGIEAERDLLEKRQPIERAQQQASHCAAGDGARTEFIRTSQTIRLERYQKKQTGLAAFLGRISGVSLSREKVYRHHDAVRMREFQKQKRMLKSQQADVRQSMEACFNLESLEVGRRLKALAAIEEFCLRVNRGSRNECICSRYS